MIVYEKCPGIGDVTKFLNKNGMSLKDVAIVYGSINRCGGSYFILYDDGKAPASKKPRRHRMPNRRRVLTRLRNPPKVTANSLFP